MVLPTHHRHDALVRQRCDLYWSSLLQHHDPAEARTHTHTRTNKQNESILLDRIIFILQEIFLKHGTYNGWCSVNTHTFSTFSTMNSTTVKSPTSLLPGFHLQRANYARTSKEPKWQVVAFWSFHLSRPKAESSLLFLSLCRLLKGKCPCLPQQ